MIEEHHAPSQAASAAPAASAPAGPTAPSWLEEIPVHAPRFWWRVAAVHVPELVPQDPDVTDHRGTYRHPDRDEQRWGLIATAVSRVSRELAAENWTTTADFDPAQDVAYGYVSVQLADLELTARELDIVHAWFNAAEAVRADPWFQIQGGRHRLWLTKAHFGTELIPVQASELLYATEPNIAELGENWSQPYTIQLEELDEVAWFDREDVLNQRFIRSMRTAAAGELPPQV